MTSARRFKWPPRVEKNDKGRVSGATYEFSIPLAALGWKPVPGQSFKGDLGILRGDGARRLLPARLLEP